MIPYRLIRSRRKTVALRLTAQGEVVVRAPMRCPRDYIDRFVLDHERWIRTHQETLRVRAEDRDAFLLTEGYPVSLCGETFPVGIVPGERVSIQNGTLILPAGDMDRIREDLLKLAKAHCLPLMEARLDRWARDMGVTYGELKLSNARTRWGSCSRNGVIRLSVWLLFAPDRAIDYVAVHELAHRRHFDHSPAFWAEVAKVMPDYDDQRKVLRRFQTEPFLQSLAKKER